MKSLLNFNFRPICITIVLLLMLHSTDSFSQANLTLTISDLINWHQPSSGNSNVSYVSIHPRIRSGNYQVSPGLDTNTKILYCPDGMNNFGPYIDSASQFNLFNFSHWQYIDILAWFGGSAGTPIILPSKAWVDAAHRNGVKVIGTVFMAPVVYGGSQAQVQSFLQQDSLGNFIAATKLIEIAHYYNFDGWIMNFETAVNSATGSLASSFMAKLDSAFSGEVIWYDAMLTSGVISYQNKLNASNSYFFQHSTGLFTNYNWSSAATVMSSNTYATNLGLSPYNVYTGADMWPNRPAQTAFTNYNWINNIITNNVAKTSIAAFATNFTFNYGPFSNFNNDSSDYNTFYSTERKIFSGIDEDPFTADATWKGFGYYVPVKTTITSLPFETDFNTGHGLNYYDNGTILSALPWHNMSHQETLPSWTFYKNNMTINYDFTYAYSGGSSLLISSTSAGSYSIPLYSTDIITSSNLLKSELVTNLDAGPVDTLSIELIKHNGSATAAFTSAVTGLWEDLIANVNGVLSGDTIIGIKLKIHSTGPFAISIGKLGIGYDSSNFVPSVNTISTTFKIFQEDLSGTVKAMNNGTLNGQLYIYDLKGSRIFSESIAGHSKLQVAIPAGSVYIYDFVSGKETAHGKLVVR